MPTELVETNLRNVFCIFQELLSKSRFLKIVLEEKCVIETVWKNCMEWQRNATSVLQDVDCLYIVTDIGDGRSNGLISKIEHLLTSLESVTKAGLSLHLDFPEIQKLQNASSVLKWCNQVLSSCHMTPPYEVITSNICLNVDSSNSF